MNHYFDSNGNSYTQGQVNYRIEKAVSEVLELQFLNEGYNYCEKCFKSSGDWLDVSHNISRKKAKELRQVELSWSLSNMEVLCRTCHKKKDKLNIQH
jgi:hypothetical protein